MLRDLQDRDPPDNFFVAPSIYHSLRSADKFAQLSHDLKSTFATLQGTRPRILYHYTSVHGVQGIISSGSIWLSDLNFLNDSSELVYAADLIMEEIKAFQKDASDSVHELLRHYLPISPTDLGRGYFAACFCTEGDLLSQWRSYSNQGKGYAIGLDAYEFVGAGVYLKKVIYDRQIQRELVRSTVQKVIELSEEIRNGRVIAELDEPNILPACRQFLSTHLGEYLFTFKHAAFSEESEWRLVIPFFREESLQRLMFHESGSLLVPYIAAQFGDGSSKPRLPVLEIVQGPSLHPELNMKAAHLLLEQHGYEHVEVRGSLAPLRA